MLSGGLRNDHCKAVSFLSVAQGQQTDSAATAIQMLVQQNLAPGIRPIALTNPNAFRSERLYTEEVDLLYKKHLLLLKAIYSACRRAPNGGGLRLKVRLSNIGCSAPFQWRALWSPGPKVNMSEAVTLWGLKMALEIVSF